VDTNILGVMLCCKEVGVHSDAVLLALHALCCVFSLRRCTSGHRSLWCAALSSSLVYKQVFSQYGVLCQQCSRVQVWAAAGVG
jgi:hypothetical protein